LKTADPKAQVHPTGTPRIRLILIMILWAACFPLIAIGVAESPHLTFAALRAFVAGAALIALAVLLRRPLPRSPAIWGLTTVVGLGASGLGFFGKVHAVEFVSPGIATVIANAQPLFAAALAYVILRERLGARSYTGLALAFAGVSLIAAPRLLGDADYRFGLALGYLALAAFGLSIANVAMKRLAGRVDVLMMIGVQLLIGALPLSVIAVATEEVAAVSWSAQFTLVLLTLALAGTALPFVLWFSILKDTELSRANSYTFLVPLLGLAAGIIFFGERLDVATLAGGVMIMIGIWHADRASRARAA
jgi:drug/metabolite transporter (DMT)-like permease